MAKIAIAALQTVWDCRWSRPGFRLFSLSEPLTTDQLATYLTDREIMVENHIHRLVVTHAREPVGIVTSIDLLRILAEQP